MKILIDARLYGLENAGLGRYLINLLEGLEKKDTNNEYVILLRKKYFDQLNFNSNFKKVLFESRHYSFLEQILLPFIIKKENPDLVHYPHFNVPIFSRKKFVVTIHDLLMHKQKGKDATTLWFPIYLLKRLFYKLVFNFAINNSKTIIVPSEYIKKEICKYYSKVKEEKIIVCYEGVNVNVEPIENANNVLKEYGIKVPYALYVGNAYPHKNLVKAIKAIEIARNNKNLNFVIVSARNVFVERLNRFIKKNKYDDFVKVLGFVPDEKLNLLYKNSECFLYPSVSEGFGLQGLEAMANKTPLVASNIEAFKEIYKDNAIYFDPKDVNSIKKALEKLLNLNKDKRSYLIDNAFEFVKKYSWDKMSEKIIKIYENSTSI
jgi:glycosyltransferase involved in cell wall biosynthesis